MRKTSSDKNLTSAEVTVLMLAPTKHIEVREKQNGTWSVFYPDPGFLPCPPGCDLAKVVRTHKHEYEQGWIESTYKPEDYADACDWAALLAEGREVKIVPFVPLQERRRKTAA